MAAIRNFCLYFVVYRCDFDFMVDVYLSESRMAVFKATIKYNALIIQGFFMPNDCANPITKIVRMEKIY